MTAPDRPPLDLDAVRADVETQVTARLRLLGAVPALLAHIDQLERRLDVALRFAMTPADEGTSFCPACSGLVRMTVGMVCPVCRTDYGPTPDPGGAVPGGGAYAADGVPGDARECGEDTCPHDPYCETYAVDDQQEGS
jgi:hypothetical protein